MKLIERGKLISSEPGAPPPYSPVQPGATTTYKTVSFQQPIYIATPTGGVSIFEVDDRERYGQISKDDILCAICMLLLNYHCLTVISL